MKLNSLLQRQLETYKFQTDSVPENATQLLQAVSDTYDEHEKKHITLQQAISLCSSEMRELNNKLRKESKELKILFETMREVFFSVDIESRKLIQISRACETVYGYPIEDFMRNPNLWAELVIEKDKHIVESIASKIKSGLPFTFNYRICRSDGIIRWMETKITPTLNQDDNVIRIDGFTSDITVRKEALSLLLGSELKLNPIFQNYMNAMIQDCKD